MRIPDSRNTSGLTANLNRLAARHVSAAAEVSSGYRVTSPSTDPRAAAELAKVRHAVERTAAFRSNIGAARGDNELAEGILAEASSLMERVQELAVQSANGTYGASERSSMAIEITGLKAQLLSMANTRGSNGYLFAGSATTTAPFNAGAVFVGNSNAHPVEIGANQVVNMAVDGAKAFTATGGEDVFLVLDALTTALNANDQTAIITTLDRIKSSHGQLVRARADSGLLLDRLNMSESALEQADLALKTRQAVLGDADAVGAMTELTKVQNSIERSLAVAQRILNIRHFEP